MRKGLLILMTLAPVSASAAVRGFVGGPRVFVGGGFYGPYWGPYWGWGGWGPYGYWGPGYAYPNTGEVKIDTKVKDAQVFLNGSYAGTTQEDKKMHLRPGSYNLEIKEHGQSMFAQKIFVTPGRTLKIHPELEGRS